VIAGAQALPIRGLASLPGPFTLLSTAASSLLEKPDQRYPTHVPLNALQKSSVALLASLGAFASPRRADLVAAVGETAGMAPVIALRDRMARNETGRLLLAERPHITDAVVSPAWDMPDGTFGAAYANFMGARGFKADERPQVRFVDDPELAWVVARAREVHDFWHVLFGCHTNVFGEVALKAVEFMQTGLPMTGMAVVAGTWRLRAEDRAVLVREFLPWAARAGAGSADLMCIYYERHLGEDLEELRKRWSIEPAPQALQNEARQRSEATARRDD
jgi:ubiquinone biosynthesis protein COQ4